jgi:tyrosine-protein phosphatase YwqE
MYMAKDENRLKELIEKGKKTQLNNKELMEMISLLGPEAALDAVKNDKS